MSAAVPASVYRLPGFLPFLVARVVVVFAVQIQAIVVAWQVYDLTRDPLSLAYVGLAQFIPMLLLLMPAGDLIDRFDRKLILMLSWLVEGVCAAALLWLSLSEAAVSWYYAVLVLYGCGRAFTGPALSSLLPQIVPPERLAAAIAANSAANDSQNRLDRANTRLATPNSATAANITRPTWRLKGFMLRYRPTDTSPMAMALRSRPRPVGPTSSTSWA